MASRNFTQYYFNNSYGSINNSYLQSKIPLLSDYVMFRSGQTQYCLVMGTTENGRNFTDAEVYVVDSSNPVSVTHSFYDTVNCTITSDYYTYSNHSGQSGIPQYTQDFYYAIIFILVLFFSCVSVRWLMSIFSSIVRRGSRL